MRMRFTHTLSYDTFPRFVCSKNIRRIVDAANLHNCLVWIYRCRYPVVCVVYVRAYIICHLFRKKLNSRTNRNKH